MDSLPEAGEGPLLGATRKPALVHSKQGRASYELVVSNNGTDCTGDRGNVKAKTSAYLSGYGQNDSFMDEKLTR